MNYNDYLKSDYWKTVTKAVKVRAGYRCQVCNSPHDLAAHHRTYEHRGDELNHLSDLVCLCRRCHAMFHGKAEPAPSMPAVLTEAKAKNGAPPKLGSRKNRQREIRATYTYDHVADMPGGDPIVLTKELVNRLRTRGGAHTYATLSFLGLTKPLIAGWPARLEGVAVPRAVYFAALKARETYNAGLSYAKSAA